MLMSKLLVAEIKTAITKPCVRNHAFRASIAPIKRGIYARQYPVTLIKPDGSTIQIKYHEPIALIKLPVDVNKLSEDERKKRLMKRQISSKGGDTKQASDKNESIIQKGVKFDPKKYLNFNKTK